MSQAEGALARRYLARVEAAGSVADLQFGGPVISWRTLDSLVEANRRALLAQGHGPGRLIGWLGHNSLEMLAAFLACARLGVVFVPMDPQQPLAALLAHARPIGLHAVLATPDATEQAGALRTALAPRADPDDQLAEGALLLPYDAARPSGARRGRIWAQDELLALGAAAAVTQGLRPGARVLAALPMFELAGLSDQLLPALLTGAQLNLRPGFDPSDWLQQLRAWQPDTSLLRPGMLTRLVADAGWAITPFGGLKTLALALRHGEAPPDPTLQQACAARGLGWCLLQPPQA